MNFPDLETAMALSPWAKVELVEAGIEELSRMNEDAESARLLGRVSPSDSFAELHDYLDTVLQTIKPASVS